VEAPWPDDRPAEPEESGPFAIPDPARAALSDSGGSTAASGAGSVDSGGPAGGFAEPTAPASPAPVETAPPEASKFTFSVQIYAGHDVDRAEEVAGAARARLPHPVVVDLIDDLYKVRVGECATRDEAFALLRIVRDSGYPDSWIVGIRRADAWRPPE
jgi:cell division septation protein DedD